MKSTRNNAVYRQTPKPRCGVSTSLLSALFLILCLTLALTVEPANAGGPRPEVKGAEESTRRPTLTKQLTQTVVFVYEDKTPQDSKKTVPGRVLGTAFIVGIPVPDRPGKVYPFIVTAKHVIANQPSVLIRYTLKSSSEPGFVRYDFDRLRQDNDFWEHPDEGVDIAVFRTRVYKDTQFLSIPIGLLASKETYVQQHISPADRIVIPCLLQRYPGVGQNYPIFRDGSLALITEEPVPFNWKNGDKLVQTKQQVLFVNAAFNEGFSGAPVFLWPGWRLTPQGNTIGGKPWLLGVVHGFQPQYRRIIDGDGAGVTLIKPSKQAPEIPGQPQPTKEVSLLSQENPATGIVFPSWQILEILQGSDVKRRVQQLTSVESRAS